MPRCFVPHGYNGLHGWGEHHGRCAVGRLREQTCPIPFLLIAIITRHYLPELQRSWDISIALVLKSCFYIYGRGCNPFLVQIWVEDGPRPFLLLEQTWKSILRHFHELLHQDQNMLSSPRQDELVPVA